MSLLSLSLCSRTLLGFALICSATFVSTDLVISLTSNFEMDIHRSFRFHQAVVIHLDYFVIRNLLDRVDLQPFVKFLDCTPSLDN